MGGGAAFVPAREVLHLSRLLYENRFRYPGDASNIVLDHGEVSQKSFREWSSKNILLWRLQSKVDPHSSVEIQSVSHAPAAGLAYQIDFSVSSRGITEYYTLRIAQVSQDTFTLIIQRKSSPSSIPMGLSAAPIVWSKAGKVGGLLNFGGS